MQEALSPLRSQTTLFSRERFTEIMENYLEHGQGLTTLLQITPASLYQFIAEVDKAESWLFYPVARSRNQPEKQDDRRRERVLITLCRILQEYCDLQGAKVGQQLLKTLLQKRAEDSGKNVLHLAAYTQPSPKVIAHLLQLASRLGIADYINIKDDAEIGGNTTALFYAVQSLQLENMRVLLEHKASVTVHHSTFGSLEKALIEKGGPEAAKAMALLAEYSKEIEQKISPYKKLRSPPLSPQSPFSPTVSGKDKYKAGERSSVDDSKSTLEITTLTDIIQARLLFELAHSKDNNLAAFIAFLQQTSTAFNNEQSKALKERFLCDLDSIQADFLRVVRQGVLNTDQEEQTEMLAVAAWLNSQQRFAGAIALYQRLISDPHSIFLTNPAQMFKMLRWSAVCMGKMQQQTQPKSAQLIQSNYIEHIEETDNLADLLAVLQAMRYQEKLPLALRQSVAGLLCDFLQGQQSSLPLLQSGLTRSHPATVVNPSSPASDFSQSSGSSTSISTSVTTPTRGVSYSLATPGVGHFSASSSSSELTTSTSLPIDSKGEAADRALVERVLRESATQTEASSTSENNKEEEEQPGLTAR